MHINNLNYRDRDFLKSLIVASQEVIINQYQHHINQFENIDSELFEKLANVDLTIKYQSPQGVSIGYDKKMDALTQDFCNLLERIKRQGEHSGYLDMCGHLVVNELVDPYEIRDVMDMYGIDAHELREQVFDYCEDERTTDYFKELYIEMDLSCSWCEEEFDDSGVCQNTECDECDDAYLSEEQIEEKYGDN